MKSSLVIFLVFAAGSTIPATYAQITITGHEQPLIDGIPQDIRCTISGLVPYVASISWNIEVGTFSLPVKTGTSGARELVFTLNPELDLDGNQFTCVVTDSRGHTYEQTITISVKELEHTLNITAKTGNPVVAGNSLTLKCIATSDRVPHLYWVGSDGLVITSGNGTTVSEVATSGVTSIITLTFDSLRTSNAGIYNCSCEIQDPPSFASTTYLVKVQIPSPSVGISRDPISSTQLFTRDRLVLTCTIDLPDTVDTPVVVSAQWSGGASLSNSPRVVITDPSSSPPYNSLVTFTSLKSSDTGQYVCSVHVSSNGVPDIVECPEIRNDVRISISLRVEIRIDYEPPSDYPYSTPPYYRPCTTATLVCEVFGATGHVSYTWTSSNSNSFVSGSSDRGVTADILTANDGGTHMCCATDEDNNRGCTDTEMVVKGAGIFINESQFISGRGVPDNSIVVPKSTACTNCKLDFYCCSDVPTGTAYLTFPDGVTRERSDDYNNIVVEQQSGTAGVQAYNYESYYPQLYGLYSCDVPSLSGDTVTSSIAVYSTLPDAPRVYDSEYFDLSEESDGDNILNITCSTSDSPPTKVLWTRDGETVDIDNINFDAATIVTDRRNLYYDNVLYVKNATWSAGRHNYECKVENSQGSDTHSMTTNIPVYDTTEITYSGSKEEGDQLVLTCTVKLRGILNRQLLPSVKLEWVGPHGVPLTTANKVFIGVQTSNDEGTSLTLTFDPLSTDHSGLYRCMVSIDIPSLVPYFSRELRHDCVVISRVLFQLQLGPVAHCTLWYDDSNIPARLETDLKTALVAAINKRCNCGFTEEAINLGELSCQTSHYAAVYRARITGKVYTATQLLALIQDWVTSEGTFLYTYPSRVRLRLDPHCPVAITSVHEPECGANVEEASKILFATTL